MRISADLLPSGKRDDRAFPPAPHYGITGESNVFCPDRNHCGRRKSDICYFAAAEHHRLVLGRWTLRCHAIDDANICKRDHRCVETNKLAPALPKVNEVMTAINMISLSVFTKRIVYLRNIHKLGLGLGFSRSAVVAQVDTSIPHKGSISGSP